MSVHNGRSDDADATTCLDCDGAGGDPDIGTCKTCRGTGDAPPGTPDPYCEPCRGDGYLYGDPGCPCRVCKGTGFKTLAPSP